MVPRRPLFGLLLAAVLASGGIADELCQEVEATVELLNGVRVLSLVPGLRQIP